MSTKVSGSEVFGTSVVKTEDYVLMARVMRDNGSDLPTIAQDIELIDDLLAMSRMQSIIQVGRFTATGRIRKNASLQDMINTRLDKFISDLKQP